MEQPSFTPPPIICINDRVLLHYAVVLMLACCAAGTDAQTRVGDQHEPNHDIRIVIHAECPHWNRTTETVVSGTVENLTDRALELSVDPVLYFSSKTSNEVGDTFWAPVDLLHDRPISTDKAKSADGKVESIQARPILLRFKNKGDTVNFRIDARHLLWAKTISSVWPSEEFFNTVKSDVYALQLVMETHRGRVESPKVEISIDASKPMDKPQSSGQQQEIGTPQSISRAMFPDAAEKALSVACFRTLKPEMSIYTVVEKCGRPDEELGSGIYIFVWHLADGSTVSIGTSSMQRIGDIRYTDPSGKGSSLLGRK